MKAVLKRTAAALENREVKHDAMSLLQSHILFQNYR